MDRFRGHIRRVADDTVSQFFPNAAAPPPFFSSVISWSLWLEERMVDKTRLSAAEDWTDSDGDRVPLHRDLLPGEDRVNHRITVEFTIWKWISNENEP